MNGVASCFASENDPCIDRKSPQNNNAKERKMKKLFLYCGVATGLLAILFGILILGGSFGGDTSTASGASALYDSGYASFGADFYTYVSNNAQEAASASRTVASNLNAIADLLRSSLGCLFIVFGLFTTCLFGLKLSEKEPQAPSVTGTAPETIPSPVWAPIEEKADAAEKPAADASAPAGEEISAD